MLMASLRTGRLGTPGLRRAWDAGDISASVAEHADSAEPTAMAALTKGGLAAVTKSLAVEYDSRGIRVNAVAPGIIQTPLHPPESYTPEALAGKLPPLGRVGQVSDIVDGIMYLESAPYVTGEIPHIGDGRTAGH
jgi:NAD(P)-dependent dehydrogenase (short-subunit alcohol dehydrogenase family)